MQDNTPINKKAIGNKHFTRWVESIRDALAQQQDGVETWALIGPAAIIEHGSEREALALATWAAQTMGIKLVTWKDQDSIEIRSTAPLILYVNREIWGKQTNEFSSEDEDKTRLEHLTQVLTELTDTADITATIEAPDTSHQFAQMGQSDTVNSTRVIIVLSTDDFGQVPEALRCLGRFDRRFDFKTQTNEEVGQAFLEVLGLSYCDQSLQSATKELGRLLNSEVADERRQGLMIASLRRRHASEKRLLRFTDVIYFALHGTSESMVPEPSSQALHRVAVHEAGHAVMSILNSNGKDMPDFAAIHTSNNFNGITTNSFSHRVDEEFDHDFVLHKVRVILSGRAAEEATFGTLGMGTRGNSGDLLSVTGLVVDMVLNGGLQSDIDDPATSADNLIVPLDEPVTHQLQRAETVAAQFVKKQYFVALKMLREHRALLDEVSQTLETKRYMTGEDFTVIWSKYVKRQTTSNGSL
jgi:hypothetical protein